MLNIFCCRFHRKWLKFFDMQSVKKTVTAWHSFSRLGTTLNKEEEEFLVSLSKSSTFLGLFHENIVSINNFCDWLSQNWWIKCFWFFQRLLTYLRSKEDFGYLGLEGLGGLERFFRMRYHLFPGVTTRVTFLILPYFYGRFVPFPTHYYYQRNTTSAVVCLTIHL